MAFIKRVGCLGSNHFCKLPAGNFSPSSLASRFHYRELSKLVKSNGNPVDTLALVRGLEAEGVPSKQAEAVTAAITQILKHSMENASQSFVSKAEMQKFVMIQESNFSKLKLEVQSFQKRNEMMEEVNISKFKSEVQSSQKQSERIQELNLSKFKSEVQSSQEHNLSLFRQEQEKLRSDFEKMGSAIRSELNKVEVGLRLEIKLESGPLHEKLANESIETSNMIHKLDGDIHAVRAKTENIKYELILYCIGTLGSTAALGLAFLRFWVQNS